MTTHGVQGWLDHCSSRPVGKQAQEVWARRFSRQRYVHQNRKPSRCTADCERPEDCFSCTRRPEPGRGMVNGTAGFFARSGQQLRCPNRSKDGAHVEQELNVEGLRSMEAQPVDESLSLNSVCSEAATAKCVRSTLPGLVLEVELDRHHRSRRRMLERLDPTLFHATPALCPPAWSGDGSLHCERILVAGAEPKHCDTDIEADLGDANVGADATPLRHDLDHRLPRTVMIRRVRSEDVHFEARQWQRLPPIDSRSPYERKLDWNFPCLPAASRRGA